ncbi:glycosyltransferase [Microbacterium sp. MC2]
MADPLTALATGIRWRWRTARIPRPSSRRSPVRLLIGPTNSAGQGFRWARSAERLGGVSACAFAIQPSDDRFRFEADGRVASLDYSQNYVWRKRQRRDVLQRFTHVLIESGKGLWRGDADAHIPELRRAGLAVGLLFHGSDIRTPHRHAELEPDSPFIEGRYPEAGKLEATTARNHQLARTAGCPVFVSTPDLLDFLPDATWLPVVVDPTPWRRAARVTALERMRPVVVHAPSRAGLKGSESIAPALRALDAEKLIEYREVSGVLSSDMPALYGDADIVLDHFVIGGYGVAACEAMAAGRVVVAHVSDRHREVVRRTAGMALPIVEARIDDIGDVIRRMLADRAGFRDLAGRGPEFVTRLHDGTHAAQVLGPFLGAEESR